MVRTWTWTCMDWMTGTGSELSTIWFLVLNHACPSPRSPSCPSCRSSYPDRWPPPNPVQATLVAVQQTSLEVYPVENDPRPQSDPQIMMARVEDDRDVDGSDAVERVAGSRGDETRDIRVLRPFQQSTRAQSSPDHLIIIVRSIELYSRTYI